MRFFFILCFFALTIFSCNTKTKTITATETVEILNNNRAEALFYFENNWKALRKKAITKNYILDFEIIETEFSETSPYHIKLVTVYRNKTQYDKREAHFQELIKESGPLKLLNSKKPNEFRKSVFSFTEPKQE